MKSIKQKPDSLEIMFVPRHTQNVMIVILLPFLQKN